MAKVVGIGAAVFDILMTADRFPTKDTKLGGTTLMAHTIRVTYKA